MASGGKPKKRTLPTWMTATHKQAKEVKRSKVTGDVDGDNCESERSQQGLKDGAITPNEGDGQEETLKSASQWIMDNMPYLKFPGRVTYTFQSSDCAGICEEILSWLDSGPSGQSAVPVGFDMEWPVTFRRGESGKTALIQMCFPDEKSYLFHVHGMTSIPKQLAQLLCHQNILLVGLNIQPDLWKLARDFDIRVKCLMDRGSVVDVGKLANEKLKSCERWDLNGLCQNVLGKKLRKDPEIRCGYWTDIPLSQDQKDYSSTDAHAGLVLYQQLCQM